MPDAFVRNGKNSNFFVRKVKETSFGICFPKYLFLEECLLVLLEEKPAEGTKVGPVIA